MASKWTFFVVIICALLFTHSIQADIVKVKITGQVTSIEPSNRQVFDFNDSIALGVPYQVSYIFDTDTPDVDPLTSHGIYLLISTSGQVGDYAWSGNTFPPGDVDVLDGTGGVLDTVSLAGQGQETSGAYLFNGVSTVFSGNDFSFFIANAFFQDSTSDQILSDELVIPNLTDWDTSFFNLSISLSETVSIEDSDLFLSGDISSLTVMQLPEPAMIGFLGLGCAFIGSSRRLQYR